MGPVLGLRLMEVFQDLKTTSNMKTIKNLILTTLILIACSQLRSQNVTILSFTVDCPSNIIECYYDQDDWSYHHSLWLESFNGTGWDSIPASYLFSPAGSLEYYSYQFLSPIPTNMYRLNYKNEISSYQFVLDTLNVDCGNSMGIETQNNSGEITDLVIYNISGSVVIQPTVSGLYIKQYNRNGRAFREKFWMK